jgi:three-Cys-motif partner protein
MERNASAADHQFGGQSTDLKLSMVEGYLKGFTTALRRKFGTLVYIDAFAGTGVRTIKYEAEPADFFTDGQPERIERRRGSAQIALDVAPPFDELVFVDAKPAHYRALCALRDANPTRKITVLKGNANDQIAEVLSRRWVGARGVIFLDPYGMAVDWTTLEAIRQTGALDVWYLVSLEGLYRQAPLDRRKLDTSKRDAISRMVGTSDWEEVWYRDKPRNGLFDDLSDDDESTALRGLANMTRTADVDDISVYFKARLKTLFPAVLEPLVLKNNAGARTFLLFFAMANPSAAAIGVATKIAGHILKAGRSSHSRPL